MARTKSPKRKRRDGPKRTAAEHQVHLELIAELHIKGQSFAQIAAGLKLSKALVVRDWQEWLAGRKQNTEGVVERQLAELDLVRNAAWEGWKRSLTDAERRTVETCDEGESSRKKTMKVVEGQAGDANFLRVVVSCNKREAEIRGTDAPKKQEVSGPGGSAIPITIVEAVEPVAGEAAP